MMNTTLNTLRMYNASVELDVRAEALAGELGDQLLERFADFHAVLARSTLGRGELILSLPAEGLWQAVATLRALVERLDVTAVTVEASDDFDRRADIHVPALLSVTEVAERLGITRAGVQHRIDIGSLPAVRVGNAWAIPAAAVRTD